MFEFSLSLTFHRSHLKFGVGLSLFTQQMHNKASFSTEAPKRTQCSTLTTGFIYLYSEVSKKRGAC